MNVRDARLLMKSFDALVEQLNLPFYSFFDFYRGYGRMGFFKYPMFHLYCLVGYILGAKNFDLATDKIRKYLGRSPHFGAVGK